MSEYNKNVKMSLIRATNAVRQKFKKLHQDRLEKRQILEEQYRPITKKMNKLMATTTSKALDINNNIRLPMNSTNISQNGYNANNSLVDVDNNHISSYDEILNDASQRSEHQPVRQSLGTEDQVINMTDSMNDNEGYDADGSYAMFLNGISGTNDSNPTSSAHGAPTLIIPHRKKRSYEHSSSSSTNDRKKRVKLISCKPTLKKKLRVKLTRFENDCKLKKYLDPNVLDKKKKKKKIGSKRDSKHSISYTYNLRNTPVRKNLPTGDGLIDSDAMIYDNNNKSYVYWDNANELCDRLKLLVASQNAGHSGHHNEIVSLIEELREAKIIV